MLPELADRPANQPAGPPVTLTPRPERPRPIPGARPAVTLADSPEPSTALNLYATIEGSGEVCTGGRVVCAVTYSLKDIEEVHRLPVAGVTGVGPRNLYGIVRTRESQVLDPFIGRRLTLRLADGESLAFTVAKVLDEPRAYLVQGLGRAD